MEEKKLIGDAQIATPIFLVEGEKDIKIDSHHLNQDYEFCIKNYTKDAVNDTAFQYKIYFQTDLEDKIQLQLEKEEKVIPLIENTTESITMEAGEKMNHLYHLKIQTKEDAEEIIGKITIRILAEQMN